MEGRIFQDGQAVRASREPEEQEDLSPGRSAGRPPKGLGPLRPEGDSPQQAAITGVRKGCWRGPGSFYTFSQGPQGPTLLPFPSEGDLEKTEQRKKYYSLCPSVELRQVGTFKKDFTKTQENTKVLRSLSSSPCQFPALPHGLWHHGHLDRPLCGLCFGPLLQGWALSLTLPLSHRVPGTQRGPQGSAK